MQRPVELSRGLKHKHRELDMRKGKLWFRVSESNTSGFIRLESESSTIHSKNRLSFSLVYLVVYFSGWRQAWPGSGGGTVLAHPLCGCVCVGGGDSPLEWGYRLYSLKSVGQGDSSVEKVLSWQAQVTEFNPQQQFYNEIKQNKERKPHSLLRQAPTLTHSPSLLQPGIPGFFLSFADFGGGGGGVSEEQQGLGAEEIAQRHKHPPLPGKCEGGPELIHGAKWGKTEKKRKRKVWEGLGR